MNILLRSQVTTFCKKHSQAKAVAILYKDLSKKNFTLSKEITDAYKNSSLIRDNIIVFRVGGNKYRVIIQFSFSSQIGRILFVGTHAQYDKYSI